MPKGVYGGRNWTPEQLARVDAGIERGLSNALLGERLGKSANAIKVIRRRHKLGAPSRTGYTARRLAAVMGLSCSKTVARWIDQGWLRGQRGAVIWGPHHIWRIEEDDLLAFLEDSRGWAQWRVEDIRDPFLRQWAHELRGNDARRQERGAKAGKASAAAARLRAVGV